MNAINLVDLRYRLEQAKDWFTGAGERLSPLEQPVEMQYPRSSAITSIASSEVVKAWTDAGNSRSAAAYERNALTAAKVNAAMRSWR